MAKQIILTQNDYGIELETQFVNDKKKPLDITDYDIRVKIIYNNETIDTILAGHKDNTNGIAYIVLEKEYLLNAGLYTTVWSVVDEDEHITAQENLYYFVKDLEGSENDTPTTDLPIDADGILNKFKEVNDDLLELNKHTNNIYNELNHHNEYLDDIDIELKNIDKTIKTIEENNITPDIQIGTVTTLEAGQQATVTREGTNENPIFNFGIPKGESGVNSSSSNNVSIDDTVIAKDKTWSSSKIEDFIHINDDVVWSTVQRENLSVDYTKEGYLREIEIWGNTIQNQDDLSDIQHLGKLYIDDEGRKQYKIEIESYNNLIDCNEVVNNSNTNFIITGDNILLKGSSAGFPRTHAYIPVKLHANKTYIFTMTWDNKTNYNHCAIFDNTKRVAYLNSNSPLYRTFAPTETKMYQIMFGGVKGDLIPISSVQIYEGSNKFDVGIRKSHKTTLLLPCQLMKVGDIADRLYLDNSKGKYIIEKKVDIPEGYDKVIDETLVLQTPQLIEANITKEILLPSYKDKTHLFVTGGIDGSIKAKAPVDGGKVISVLQGKNTELEAINSIQDELINTTMLATDEMYIMLEPLLAETLNERSMSKMVDMYVAMVQRGIKRIDEVPSRYREQVKKNIRPIREIIKQNE